MYNHFKGKITDIESNYIVLEVNDIGYQLKVPNPFFYQENSEYTVYTYLHVREDIFDLYGFLSVNERDFFINLISVKGIGPKSALAILASGQVDEIVNAIESADDKYLTKFPGIGPKASKQIVLDLKGKLVTDEVVEVSKYSDVVSALIALGYKKKDVEKLVEKLPTGLCESDAIKEVLKQL